jgi:Spy/CpxP family protein refolding chaperone
MRPRLIGGLALAFGASVLTLAAAETPAPTPGLRGSNKAELLQNASVQEDLKLSAEQLEQLKKLAREFEDKHKDDIVKARKDKDIKAFLRLRQEALEFFSKEMSKVLKDAQLKRLDQIEMQLHGIQALLRPDVQTEMKLTDKQRKELRDILDNVRKDVQSAMESTKGAPDKKEEVGRRITQLHKLATEKAFGLLSDDQKKAWTDLVGEPFELKAKAPPGAEKEHPKKDG